MAIMRTPFQDADMREQHEDGSNVTERFQDIFMKIARSAIIAGICQVSHQPCISQECRPLFWLGYTGELLRREL